MPYITHKYKLNILIQSFWSEWCTISVPTIYKNVPLELIIRP